MSYVLCQDTGVTFHSFVHLLIHLTAWGMDLAPFARWNSYICSPGRSLVRSMVLIDLILSNTSLAHFLVGLHLG